MEKINTKIFIEKASKDSSFLKIYIADPNRLLESYEVEDDLINKLKSSQSLLEAVANLHPKKLSKIAKFLYDPTIVKSDFRDGGAGGYQDGFNDNSDFTDKYTGPKRSKILNNLIKSKDIVINPGKGEIIIKNLKGKL